MSQPIKIFSKSLSDTDIKKRMAIPAKILPFLPQFNGSNKVTIKLMYETKIWPIVCSIRKKGYKKPAFSGGWRQFVICNSFNVGDKLTLYKVQNEEDYRVEVEKPGEGDAPVAFIDYTEPATRIFCTNVSAEAARKDHFKSSEQESKNFFTITKRICMGDPMKREKSYYMTNDEREIKSFALAEDGAMSYGTSQAVRDAYYKSPTDIPAPCVEKVNLNLTLAPPVNL